MYVPSFPFRLRALAHFQQPTLNWRIYNLVRQSAFVFLEIDGRQKNRKALDLEHLHLHWNRFLEHIMNMYEQIPVWRENKIRRILSMEQLLRFSYNSILDWENPMLISTQSEKFLFSFVKGEIMAIIYKFFHLIFIFFFSFAADRNSSKSQRIPAFLFTFLK